MAGPALRVTGASVQGASHRRSGIPNQDACAWLPASGAGDVCVAAVSDGHGSHTSFRSDVGSRLAVEIATKVLWDQFAEARADQDGERQFRDALREITERWSAQVSRHRGQHPIADEELARLEERGGAAALNSLRRAPELAYGATLLCVAVTRTAVYYGQLGDGDILAVSAKGRVRRPLPADQRLIANETTSLCGTDAARQFRVATEGLGRAPRLVLLMTDGYFNSFPTEEEFQQVGSDLLKTLEHEGIEAIEADLEGWLTETTDRGAGDDVTLTLVTLPAGADYDEPAIPLSPRREAPRPSAQTDGQQTAPPLRPHGGSAIVLDPAPWRSRASTLALVILALVILALVMGLLLGTRLWSTPAPPTACAPQQWVGQPSVWLTEYGGSFDSEEDAEELVTDRQRESSPAPHVILKTDKKHLVYEVSMSPPRPGQGSCFPAGIEDIEFVQPPAAPNARSLSDGGF